jgi:hypothetical protein
MVSTRMRKQIERLRQLICERIVGLAVWACGKNAGLKALETKVEELQYAKRQRLPTNDDVFETDVLVRRVLEFVGPDQYLFAASINRKSRQMQIVLSYQRAEGSSNAEQAKLRTSLSAALTSPARLRWAFSSGSKQKDKYDKPLQLVQSALKASGSVLTVLSLLNVQSMKGVEQKGGSELYGTAAKTGDWKLLKWLHAHDCPWDARVCRWADLQGRLDILTWAHENGCPWDATTCSYAAESATCTSCSGRASRGVLGMSTRALMLLTTADCACCSGHEPTAAPGILTRC